MDNEKDLKYKAINGIVWKGLERVAAQLVSVIVGIILARVLIPDDYSVVSIVAIFFAICNVFISGGLNTALIQKKDADELDYSTIFVTNLLVATVLYGVMFFTSPLIANLFHKELLKPVIRVMAFMFFINGYKAILSAKILSDLEFKKFFYSTIIGTLISAVIGISMALNGYGPWALVAQQMSNSFIDTLVLFFTTKVRFKITFSMQRFKTLFSYGGRIMASSLINEGYNQVKPVIVGLRFSAVDLAYYNKGKNYPDLVTSTANDTLSSSLFPVLSKVQNDKEAVLRMTRRFMQLSSFLVFPMMLGFLSVSEGFVRIVLTDKWLPIVPYIMIFCISDMLKPIQTGNLQAIRAIGRADVFLKLEIIKKVTFLVVIFLFVVLTNDPIWLAVSGIVTSLIASLVNTYPNRKLIGYGYRLQFTDISINLATSVIMAAVIYFIRYLNWNIILITVIQIVSGMVLYLGINILVNNASLFYLMNLIKGRVRKQ